MGVAKKCGKQEKDSRLTKFWWDANPAAPHVYEWVLPTMRTAYQ